MVLSREELEVIAALCRRFDTLAIVDEVYEHIVFDGRRHIQLSTLPGMWERTLTLNGASKTFSSTGRRLGWAIGPASLPKTLNPGRQFSVFGSPSPLQLATARCLLCAVQAIYLQRARPRCSELRLGGGTGAAYEEIHRAGILPVTQDRVLYPDIRKARELERSGALVRAAREPAC